jgi:hypothetical protein
VYSKPEKSAGYFNLPSILIPWAANVVEVLNRRIVKKQKNNEMRFLVNIRWHRSFVIKVLFFMKRMTEQDLI